MNRHFWRACDRAAGFSFVELLVTIIIAGIAFAALVPVFVGAAEQSGLDNSRNVASNIAQQQIEKLRVLEYDQVLADAAHLNSETFSSAQFGNEYVYDSGVSVKTYWVDYGVSLFPSTATAGSEDYKQVQVRVSWAPTEADITSRNSVTLRTIIYKQYAGPAILGPPRITSPVLVDMTATDGTEYSCVTSRDMVMEIDVDPNKLATTARVVVGIYSATGELIEELAPEQVVQFGSLNQWRAMWTAPSTVNDGAYVIKAVALSTSRYAGNTASRDFQLELGSPGDVSSLTATPGDGLAQLDWVPPTAADLDHYEIYRSPSSTFGTDPLVGDWTAVGYTDPQSGGDALTNGVAYYYKVVVVDMFGQASTGAVVSVTPEIPVDRTAPYPPSNLLWSAAGKTITLSWTASPGDVDVAPVTGLGDYFLYGSESAAGPFVEVWHGITINTVVTLEDYDETRYFRVTAKDLALNESAPTNTVAATSQSVPRFNLSVNNPLSSDRYVRVHSGSLTGPLVGTSTSWLRVKKRSTNSSNWRQLPVGKYYVEWSTSSSGSSPKNDNFTQLSSALYTFVLY